MENDDQRYCSSNSSSSSTDSNANYRDSYIGHHLLNNSRSMVSPSYNSATQKTTSSSFCTRDLSTDLRLGLSISSHDLCTPLSRGQYSNWPPMKPLLRSTLAAGKSNCRPDTLFVKVSMEGIPIGRKLDLLAHHGYHSLITALVQMFRTTILFSNVVCHDSPNNCHILTYEDKEGDWMMVGDVPWEMFLTSVKRLKIVSLENCQ